jgi:hypothetical protein
MKTGWGVAGVGVGGWGVAPGGEGASLAVGASRESPCNCWQAATDHKLLKDVLEGCVGVVWGWVV